MEITLEEIQKKFEGLPEDLKWAIMAANVDDNIIEIGQMNGLNVDQMGQLSLETNMVMFGFTHPDKFEESVKNSIGLGDEKTRVIVNAVNEKILKEIKEKFMQMYDNAPKKNIAEHDTEEEKKANAQVLNTAGIEILNGKTGAVATQMKEKLPVIEKLELPTKPTILEQKLKGSFQNGMVKTEHSLGNLTKTSEAPTSEAPKPAPSHYPPKGDPYRLPPE